MAPRIGCSPWGHTESDTTEATQQQQQQQDGLRAHPVYLPVIPFTNVGTLVVWSSLFPYDFCKNKDQFCLLSPYSFLLRSNACQDCAVSSK